MKLLANENFLVASVKFIENKNHDIVSVGRDYAELQIEKLLILP